jgi:hypothetical protein
MNIHTVSSLSILKALLKEATAAHKTAKAEASRIAKIFYAAESAFKAEHPEPETDRSRGWSHFFDNTLAPWQARRDSATKVERDAAHAAWSDLRAAESNKLAIKCRTDLVKALERRAAGKPLGEFVVAAYEVRSGDYRIGRKKMAADRYVAFEIRSDNGEMVRAIGPTGSRLGTLSVPTRIVPAIPLPL